MRIAIAAAMFHRDIVAAMVERALKRAKERGLAVAEVVEVPGTWEIPLAVDRLLQQPDLDGVVALGAVIQGETKHDEVLMQVVPLKLQELALRAGKPVGFGITGPGLSQEKAKARIEYAERAVDAVAYMGDVLGSRTRGPRAKARAPRRGQAV